MNSHQWKVCVFVHVCKYVPKGNMCTGEEGQLRPNNSVTPLHSRTADNAIRLHKYNKSKDKFMEQLRTTTGLKSTEGNLAECELLYILYTQ